MHTVAYISSFLAIFRLVLFFHSEPLRRITLVRECIMAFRVCSSFSLVLIYRWFRRNMFDSGVLCGIWTKKMYARSLSQYWTLRIRQKWKRTNNWEKTHESFLYIYFIFDVVCKWIKHFIDVLLYSSSSLLGCAFCLHSTRWSIGSNDATFILFMRVHSARQYCIFFNI